MKSENSLYRDRYNVINIANPPKSMFTVEKTCRKNFKSFINVFHYHDWYELYYITKGRCVYQVANKSFLLEPGDWIFIPPKVKHKNFYRTENTERYLVYFSKDYINPCLHGKICEFALKTCFSPENKESTYLTNLISNALEEFQNPSEFSKELYKSYLFQIMITLLTKAPMKESDGQNMNMYFLAQNTIEYINDHFNENITLNELADMNYITPGYLSSVFKKATGFNISNFIQTRRLIHAKNLLCETDDSISVISEKCGFNDSNYFSVVFKKYTSQSPLQYRKTHS